MVADEGAAQSGLDLPGQLLARLMAVVGDDEDRGPAGGQIRQRAQDVLKPGTAALVLFLESWTEDKALAALAPLGGEVLKTSLSDEATREINAALEADKADGTPAAPAG